MKISTKGRYGTRLMLDLAVHYEHGPIALKDIAARQDISVKYLEQIISALNKAGLIHSIRGAQGGYMLNTKPEEITVGMILRVLEGSLAPVGCVDGTIDCDRISQCATAGVWQRLYDAINQVVDNVTLADLVADHMAKDGIDYSI